MLLCMTRASYERGQWARSYACVASRDSVLPSSSSSSSCCMPVSSVRARVPCMHRDGDELALNVQSWWWWWWCSSVCIMASRPVFVRRRHGESVESMTRISICVYCHHVRTTRVPASRHVRSRGADCRQCMHVCSWVSAVCMLDRHVSLR